MNDTWRRSLALLGCGVCLLAGCSQSDWDPNPEPMWVTGQGSRTVVPLTLDTLFHIDGRVDASLVSPSVSRGTDRGLIVLDRVDQAVSLFAEDGHRVWTFGREGQGPGEFLNVRDLRPTSSDRVVVYDVGNNKLATLDVATGTLRSELRLPEQAGIAESMVPLGDSVLLITFRPQQPLALVSLVDGSVETFEMPWPGFRRLHALHRQGITAVEGSSWVYLFRHGNGFFPFEGAEPLGYLGQYVEHLPFPPLSISVTADGRSISFVGDPVCSACSASLVRDTLFVHFGGETELGGRMIDAYDVRTGEYLVTYELPTRLRYVEVADDWISGVHEDPYPQLLLLSRRGSATAAEGS